MAETTKKKGLGLPQTRGTFQLRGKVTDVYKRQVQQYVMECIMN